jgi:phospholipid/cholesterol/gamma-HCH transport system substrate-binding protein
VPRLIRDGEEADRLSRAVKNLENTSSRLNQILDEVNTAVERVNQGPGLAHEVLYGEDGAKAVAQFGRAADEVALTLQGIREGDGIAHQVLYGGGDANSQKIVEDIAAITGDFRILARNLREGKGTHGALMVDPSVYEDVKVLLGNVQRNEVLRALVRYSIQQDEQRPRVEVRDPEPAAAGQAKN